MRLIRQYNECDCGLSVAAMICGKKWQDAVDADPAPQTCDGLTTKEFLIICSRLGAQVGMIRAGGKMHLRNAVPPINCCGMLVRRFGGNGYTPRAGHYVAFDGKRVFDPGCVKPVPWSVYRQRKWKICRWFVRC